MRVAWLSRGRSWAGMALAGAVTLGALTAAGTPGPATALAMARLSARPPSSPATGITFPLHTSGANVVDAAGKRVKLDLVNWYGAESPDFVVGGLAYQPVGTIINEIVSMGFDGVRLPWSNQMWEANPVVPASLVAANPQFSGEHARTVFQQIVSDLAAAGLMVVLDNHTSDAQWCCSDTDGNTLWYNSAYPESSWLADWRSMAQTFGSVPQVIGADLRNEPRGSAAWGGSDPSVDWHAAAERGGNAILAIDPHWLIFVEGTGYAHDLSGVASLPVTLNVPNQVVYSVHDYGFQHSGVTSYDSWVAQIQAGWGWLVGKDPLWVGEFGTCNTADTCVSSSNSADPGLWFGVFTRYLRYHDLDWSYWPLNGTESDGLARPGADLRRDGNLRPAQHPLERDRPASAPVQPADDPAHLHRRPASQRDLHDKEPEQQRCHRHPGQQYHPGNRPRAMAPERRREPAVDGHQSGLWAVLHHLGIGRAVDGYRWPVDQRGCPGGPVGVLGRRQPAVPDRQELRRVLHHHRHQQHGRGGGARLLGHRRHPARPGGQHRRREPAVVLHRRVTRYRHSHDHLAW